MTQAQQVLLLTDFTAQPLVTALARLDGRPQLEGKSGPFDRAMEVLNDGKAPCWAEAPDFAFVWTAPEKIVPSLGAGGMADRAALDRDFDLFADALAEAAGRVKALFFAAWSMAPWQRGLGPLDLRGGKAHGLMHLNTRLLETAQSLPNVYVLDAPRWLAASGQAGWDNRSWYLSKVPFTTPVYQTAARELQAAAAAVLGLRRKLLILDLDDTLWGGTVGEDGWRNLRLGGHDPVGEALADFQRDLKTLAAQGVMLALVSKNTEAVALEAIDSHPEMLLKRSDFVGWRINWQDKADNIAELVAELNIGLDAVVFIDNDRAERDRVRQALPDVLVPEWPEDKASYAKALQSLTCFDALTLSHEDGQRTRMYVEDRQRQDILKTASSKQDWLALLELQAEITLLGSADLPRAAQLLNKTNQMNLTTRRLGEDQLMRWAQEQGRKFYVVRVKDRLGDYGLTGLLGLEMNGSEASLADFVLSCRVIGRGVEQALLHAASQVASQAGCKTLIARFVPTERNQPCKSLFESDANFTASGGADLEFRHDLNKAYPKPLHVELNWIGQP
ncbi:MAG: HAD-IIIC family phosphatase [Alphaproteobacteria bacterium]|nr:HAD-IIIC family phosphatase [Alphaproteobacteria bacterium]